jgi:deazaflavin-dependent oxidoreductase (nitroreductase family)
MTNDVNEMNRSIIAEFRENAGKVGGRFEAASILLLHSTGAKSGAERINPLAYQPVGDAHVVFASKAGAPTNPDWYHNLVANPDSSIEVGTETIEVRARVAAGDEREQIWSTQKQNNAVFAGYESKAGNRTIPVVILERR